MNLKTDKIRRQERQKAIKALAKLPDAFPHIKDSAKYISKLRKDDDKIRTDRLK